MFANRLAASLAIAIFLIGYPLALWAEELLNVETWPGDIPCNLLKKHPDGAYEDHRRLEPLLPAARARHEIPQYARDQLLGPEVQGPDAVARMSAAYAIALPIRHGRAWPGHPRKRNS